MPLICVSSPKGGVGKTTLVANLAYALARAGNKVLALDLDVQNSLRLHFGVPFSDERGYVATSQEAHDWSSSIFNAGSNLFLLPYGVVTDEQRLTFESSLAHDKNFLSRGLGSVLNYPGLIIVADLPQGPSAALSALSPLSDLHLIPLMADPASMATVPQVEEHPPMYGHYNPRHGFRYVVNQANSRRQISRDVLNLMEERFGERLLGVVHQDECVAEAGAAQQSIFNFHQASAAAFDIEILAKKVVDILGISVGNGTIPQKPGKQGF
ncbi:cellulose synthase operon protein YhjQ [Enterobacteriaceae bacterium RIT691]|nr:cellulose synthase operon protein YhjQ [Enterobacteriaceae bacterium RIT691]